MGQTQNLILRIVAQRGMVSSGELLEVLHKFGRSPDAVRAAANRMVKAGLLAKTGRGRGNLRYRIGPQGQVVIDQFIDKTVHWHMALEGQPRWDGTWVVVTFSIPEGRRGKRDAFRVRLTQMGFGLLSSSVWVSPLDHEMDVTALIEELDLVGQVALLRCQHMWMPGVGSASGLASRLWELTALAARYRDFNTRVDALLVSLERARQGKEVDVESLFFEAMDLQGELIDIILTEDPCLPPELLPSDWPGQRTHKLLHLLTRAINQLETVASRYDYLFHLIQGMEVLEAFLPEGDDSLHWPETGEVTG
jgi:phenylacetic acid degradation operon negative regulatory protein